MTRLLSALLGAAAVLVAAPAQAETAAEALAAFGLIGTWSPDCSGPIHVIYALHPGAAPTATAVIDGTEQAIDEIHDAARVGADRIRWTGVYTKYSPLDVPKADWMPAPGETWETVLEMVDGKIRSLESQERMGEKILVRDGFYYVADDAAPGHPTIWHKADKPTPLFSRCSVGLQ